MSRDWVLSLNKVLDDFGAYLVLAFSARLFFTRRSPSLESLQEEVALLTSADCFKIFTFTKEFQCPRITLTATSYKFLIGGRSYYYHLELDGNFHISTSAEVEALPWMYDLLCRQAARKSTGSRMNFLWDPTHTYCFEDTFEDVLEK